MATERICTADPEADCSGHTVRYPPPWLGLGHPRCPNGHEMRDLYVPPPPPRFTRCTPRHRSCSPAHSDLVGQYHAAKDQNDREVEDIAIGYEGDRQLAIARGLVTILTFKAFISHR